MTKNLKLRKKIFAQGHLETNSDWLSSPFQILTVTAVVYLTQSQKPQLSPMSQAGTVLGARVSEV